MKDRLRTAVLRAEARRRVASATRQVRRRELRARIAAAWHKSKGND